MEIYCWLWWATIYLLNDAVSGAEGMKHEIRNINVWINSSLRMYRCYVPSARASPQRRSAQKVSIGVMCRRHEQHHREAEAKM